jgi:hypothetical protein
LTCIHRTPSFEPFALLASSASIFSGGVGGGGGGGGGGGRGLDCVMYVFEAVFVCKKMRF